MPTRIALSVTIMLLLLFVARPGLFVADANAQVPQQSVFQPKHFGTRLQGEQARKEFKERKRQEERAVVGQPFPSFLKAYDAAGNKVTMRDLLHGPTVVIQLISDSSFSNEILAYLREHGTDYAKKHHVQVVVVANDYYGNDYANMLLGLPKSIVGLYVTGSLALDLLQNQVIGGPVSPAIVFLDKNLFVVDRKLGLLRGNPQETLTSTDAFK